MRVLIIGARGMLDTNLLKEWDTDELIPAFSQDANVRIAEQVHRLLARTRPDWTLLTAAYTDVTGGERNPEKRFRGECQWYRECGSPSERAGLSLVFREYGLCF
jgi:dTDP-4-dehydrorhamnose reductase